MGKVQAAVSGAQNFIGEVHAELKKCAWPTQSELIQSTGVVIVSVFILAIVVSVSDLILMQIMKLVIR
ncbi:MAG TPA: preprotein translocase subunit SecE [Kiritimatiellia bacterium]|nr:preprotein translocase subunit SecE [Kiritimatiellia bacterium]HMO98809.1 preprotein translocase subunit SecE [Kiritimatiellia bacterium]HMP96243.1 preprotein translocase subunit SecE [Kiritimatiellia bacterium]